jgi:hypothetical protein
LTLYIHNFLEKEKITKITLIKTADGQFQLKKGPSTLLVDEKEVAGKSLKKLYKEVFCTKTEDKIQLFYVFLERDGEQWEEMKL